MTNDNQFTEIKTGMSKEMPAKLVIMGVPKIGKSRFAAAADDPFYLNIEGGLDYIGKDVRATPLLTAFDDVIGWLKHIYETDAFQCKTIVLDSADWLESLAQARLVKLHNAKSITDPSVKEFAYFRCVVTAAEDAQRVLGWLDAIYKKRGIKCIIIAHTQIRNVDLPNKEQYSRYELKLSKYFGSRLNEWADLLLFADYSFHVTQDGKTSEPKPMLFAGGSASFIGGGRMQLKKEIPLDYNSLKKEITT
jgi:hypothetical protein